MTHLFSIIIPVYNVAPYLRECLDSVLAQTFADWECLCVDDGSTDGSGAILDEYAAKDKRFRVIHQKNAGVSAARNRALREISGKWILFLDGDDVWRICLLMTVASLIESHPDVKLFRFGYEQFCGDGWSVGCVQTDSQRSITTIDITNKISMHDFSDYLFWCHAYMRDTLDGVVFPKYIRGEDRCLLNHVMLNRVNAIVATEEKLYGYRKRVGSAVNSQPSLQVLCDEMDHRLDIMEMIDASSKQVDYASNGWLEGYFTKGLILLALDRQDDADAVRAEWRLRLPRLLKCKGLSRKGRGLIGLCSNPLSRPIGEFIVFALPYLRYNAPVLRPMTRLYRKLLRHGEFSRKK